MAIVDDLIDSANNLLGSAGQPHGGKFTLRAGDPSGRQFAPHAQIDLHQLGAGYLGHSWFTHVYGDQVLGTGYNTRQFHKTVGT